MTEPSPGELMRKFDDIARRLDSITSTLETSYVRKDAHEQAVKAVEAMHLAAVRLIEAQREADRNTARRASDENAQDIKEIRADRDRDVAWKRQMTATLITSLIGLVGTAGATVFSIVAGG